VYHQRKQDTSHHLAKRSQPYCQMIGLFKLVFWNKDMSDFPFTIKNEYLIVAELTIHVSARSLSKQD
jgi:hypothetical protein